MRHPSVLPMLTVALVALAACSAPAPAPDGDPQAGTAPGAVAEDHTELRDAIAEPLDKARAVEDIQAADEAERDEALDAAGG